MGKERGNAENFGKVDLKLQDVTHTLDLMIFLCARYGTTDTESRYETVMDCL